MTKYVSRTKAVKLLQISLRDFRRLCILKGIYPRQPSGSAAKQKTYYHAKDILFLSHEPLLSKFRDFKAFMKKVRKLINRKEHDLAISLYEQRPRYDLKHLVKERYPTITSALSSIDDALNLIYLFARLPSNGPIRSEKLEACLRMCHLWDSFIQHSGTLSKAFVSVKGIYYQATIKGQSVTWLVPFQFSQNLPSHVDYRVMLTFLDFYETLLGSVIFALHREYFGQLPAALEFEHVLAQGNIMVSKSEEQRKSNPVCNVFSNLVFQLNREVPIDAIKLCIFSAQGCISDSKSKVADQKVTHVVTDRPINPSNMLPGVEYVQPQWIFDCFNAKSLLPSRYYSSKVERLPPHFSPFEEDCSVRYKTLFAMGGSSTITVAAEIKKVAPETPDVVEPSNRDKCEDLTSKTVDDETSGHSLSRFIPKRTEPENDESSQGMRNAPLKLVPSKVFRGSMLGYVFRSGSGGTGYYEDPRSDQSPFNPAEKNMERTLSDAAVMTMSRKAQRLLKSMHNGKIKSSKNTRDGDSRP